MFHRLDREQPWKAQIGCTFLIALVVAAPGLFIGYMTYFHDHSDKRMAMFGFSAIWVLVAFFLLLGGIHQLFAVRSPETIVEIDVNELAAGAPMRIRVTQPGPLRMLSIHANLAGEETTFYNAPNGKRTSTTRYFGPYRMLEIERHFMPIAEQVLREATFTVPDEVAPSVESADVRIRWKIEVWGRVRWRPDFMHPFPVTVAKR